MRTSKTDKTLNSKIDAIKTNCILFDVKVAMIRRADRYYIKLSMKPPIHDTKWTSSWGGFYAFALHQIKPYYPDACVTSASTTSATFFVGKFFDFLTGEK